MAGGWWGENREGRTWEGKGRTMEGEEGRGKNKGKGEQISVG